jgi:pimeloyl-ACP methyl ester carboxylesterase
MTSIPARSDAFEAFLRAIFGIDARPLLPLIQASTLVLHRSDLQALPIQHGRWLAARVAGANLVEVQEPTCP